MTVRKTKRSGKLRWVIDIPYRRPDGTCARYRRDAQVQSKEAARAEERRLLARLAEHGDLIDPVQDDPPPSSDLTFQDAVDLFRKTKAVALKPSTRITYANVLDAIVLPKIGSIKLEDVAAKHVLEIDAEMISGGARASTRRNVQIALRSVLRNAVELEELAELPRLPKLPRLGRIVLRPLLAEHLDAVSSISSSSLKLAISLSRYAGLRAGELRGLRWRDVDLEREIITVRTSVCRGEEAPPKSGDQREVPIAAPLLSVLEEASTRPHKPEDQVALTRAKETWGERGLNRAFQRALARAKLPTWRFHDIRHHFVSQLFRNGAPAPAVQALAGHADLTTTQRYAHMTAADLKAAVSRLDGNSVETPSK